MQATTKAKNGAAAIATAPKRKRPATATAIMRHLEEQPMTTNWAAAIHQLVAAHTAVLRDVMRHLVEEGLLPPDTAGRILRDAAENDLPAAESTGETWDAARGELLAIAAALDRWPGSAGARRAPRADIG